METKIINVQVNYEVCGCQTCPYKENYAEMGFGFWTVCGKLTDNWGSHKTASHGFRDDCPLLNKKNA